MGADTDRETETGTGTEAGAGTAQPAGGQPRATAEDGPSGVAEGRSAAKQPQPGGRWIWRTPRAIAMHTTMLVVVPGFVALFWWQVQRVRQGNALSWAYVFEWPFFIAYAVYMWWKLVHEQDVPVASAGSAVPAASASGASAVGRPSAEGAPADALVEQPLPNTARPATPGDDGRDRDDEELAAYNRYLAELDASGRRKRW